MGREELQDGKQTLIFHPGCTDSLGLLPLPQGILRDSLSASLEPGEESQL